MALITIGDGFDQCGPIPGACALGSVLHRLIDCNDIIAINGQSFDPVRARAIADLFHTESFFNRHGHGILVIFSLASDAVRCAIEIQKACKALKIPLKIGIHQGEIEFAGSDVSGDGVNIASRLQSETQQGCINISGAVFRDVLNKVDIQTKFVKDKTFKNVDEPISIYQVLCGNELKQPPLTKSNEVKRSIVKPYYFLTGLVVVALAVLVVWKVIPRMKSVELEKSIAVLPFETITKDSTSQYMADGVREAILKNLLKIKNLKVVSRTSSQTYRNSNKRIPKIASELNVAFILEGSAQKFGNQIRITVQLIDGKTDRRIWSQDYDRAWGDIFKIYSEIATKVSTALQVVITPEEQEQISSALTMDVTAYDYFLQAKEEQWKFWRGGDTVALSKAEMLYNKVMKISPEYAPNWLYKASIYYDRHAGIENYFETKHLDSVLLFCDKAIRLDPSYDHPYVLKGMVLHRRGDVDQAIKSYEKAITLYRNDDNVLSGGLWRLGTIFLYKKEYLKGIWMIRKAVEKARGRPQDYRHMLYRLGNAYMYIGAYEEAKLYFDEWNILGGGFYFQACRPELLQGNFYSYSECLAEVSPTVICNKELVLS